MLQCLLPELTHQMWGSATPHYGPPPQQASTATGNSVARFQWLGQWMTQVCQKQYLSTLVDEQWSLEVQLESGKRTVIHIMTHVISLYYWMPFLNVMCQWPGFSTIAFLTIWVLFYEGSKSVHHLVQKLPLQDSLVFQLIHNSSLTYSQCCTLWGLTTSTVADSAAVTPFIWLLNTGDGECGAVCSWEPLHIAKLPFSTPFSTL